jgi:hypothetical protein
MMCVQGSVVLAALLFQGVKAASSSADCRAQYNTGTSAMKDSTGQRVQCNTTTKLARNIIPAYPYKGDVKDNNTGTGSNPFQVAMEDIPRYLEAVSCVGC